MRVVNYWVLDADTQSFRQVDGHKCDLTQSYRDLILLVRRPAGCLLAVFDIVLKALIKRHDFRNEESMERVNQAFAQSLQINVDAVFDFQLIVHFCQDVFI